MILYFSGTGNSAYVAKRIGKEVMDDVINLFEKIRNKDNSKLYSEDSWIIVVPTYAWRIPHIVQNWIENTEFTGSKDIYFVMTCGENIEMQGNILKVMFQKNMNYYGCAEIVMPENYIALFLPNRRTGNGDYRTGRSCHRQGGKLYQKWRGVSTGKNFLLGIE